MPNRYIREDAIESESVNALGWQGEVFWRRLMNRVDDFGRHSANTALLRAALFPLQLTKVSESDVSKLLLECEKCGLLKAWVSEDDGKPYLVLSKWEKGRALKSKYPAPPAHVLEFLQTSANKCLHLQSNAPDSDTDSDTDNDNAFSGLPAELDTPAFRETWETYLKYRREAKFKKLKAASIEAQWKQFVEWGVDAAIASIKTTIRNQWQGIFEPKQNHGKSTRPPSGGTLNTNNANSSAINEY